MKDSKNIFSIGKNDQKLIKVDNDKIKLFNVDKPNHLKNNTFINLINPFIDNQNSHLSLSEASNKHCKLNCYLKDDINKFSSSNFNKNQSNIITTSHLIFREKLNHIVKLNKKINKKAISFVNHTNLDKRLINVENLTANVNLSEKSEHMGKFDEDI